MMKFRYTVTVHLTVNDEYAQGDEADLFQEHIASAMQSFGLEGCSYEVGPVVPGGAES